MMAMRRCPSSEGGDSKVEVYVQVFFVSLLMRVCFGVGSKEQNQNQSQPERKRPARSVVGVINMKYTQ
jgi:hypothetical protein